MYPVNNFQVVMSEFELVNNYILLPTGSLLKITTVTFIFWNEVTHSKLHKYFKAQLLQQALISIAVAWVQRKICVFPWNWIAIHGVSWTKTLIWSSQSQIGPQTIRCCPYWDQFENFLEKKHICQLCHDMSAKFPVSQFHSPTMFCLFKACIKNVLSQFSWRDITTN